MQESVQSFFGYKSMDEAMIPCAEPHVNMNYMHAPDYDLQMRFLSRYMADAAPPDRLLTLVLSVGYWVWTPEVPQVREVHLLTPRLRLDAAMTSVQLRRPIWTSWSP